MTEELDFLPDEKPKHEAVQAKGITRGTLLLVAVILVAMALLGIQLFRQNQTQPTAGHRAPDFTLLTYDLQTFKLSELRGQIVVVNFWANWCPPCHAEAYDLQDIHETYADKGVLLLGINWLDIESDAKGFMERYGITYPNGPDVAERISKSYHFQGPPETFVINKDGKIAGVFIGQLNYEMLAEVLDKLLAEDKS